MEFEETNVNGFDISSISGVDLGDFLKRPVLIDTFTWEEGNFSEHSFDPWSLYLSNFLVKKKLDNYGLLRCNLHLKWIVSASPFYYGLNLISYNPMPETHPIPSIVIGGDQQMVTRSQRPHLWLNVDTSEGGEMVLPFFYPENWVENRALSITRLGDIHYSSPRVLANANATAGGKVTIACYAWCENMEMAAPTLVLQSKRSATTTRKSKSGNVVDRMSSFDEYGSGPVSNIASAVASAGAALSNVPVIGPFARATEIGAGALSRVAAWFGYTNVPVISNVMPFKELPFGGMASSEISAPTPKLTLDPKNELTLDSRTVGLDGTDELSLESFVTRESYYTTFDWSEIKNPGDALFLAYVAPALIYRRGLAQISWPTPLSFASTMYQYWTGDVIFRFRILCTQYHRGRFKIQFEPSANGSITFPMDDTANITRIFDIGECRDIEICVPYMQAKAFLPIVHNIDSSDIPFAPDGIGLNTTSEVNGVIKVSVVTKLTSPVASAPISLVVSVRGAENLKFMGPTTPSNGIQLVSQSDKVACISDSMGNCDEEEPMVNLVYGGETALSFRQLLHRHCFVRSIRVGLTSQLLKTYQTLYPPALNYTNDTRNIYTAQGGAKVNYVANNFVSWISPCYAGRRGSMYWAYNPSTSSSSDLTVEFVRAVPFIETPDVISSLTLSYNEYALQRMNTSIGESGKGCALYNTKTQTGSTVLVPFVANERFVNTFANPLIPGSLNPRVDIRDLGFGGTFNGNTGGHVLSTDVFCASGPDFNLFFFTGCPCIELSLTQPP